MRSVGDNIRRHTMQVQALAEQFAHLWERIGAAGSPQFAFTDLVARYSKPERAYHTLTHVQAMLSELYCAEDSGILATLSPLAVKTAIWYHDAVYDTHTKDNEEKSAELFRGIAASFFVKEGFARQVAQLILATKRAAVPSDRDAMTLCDIDLTILGYSEPVFDEYERAIRTEYSWMPEKRFRERRAALLSTFLRRDTIYTTTYFRRRYENQARINLRRSLTRLCTP